MGDGTICSENGLLENGLQPQSGATPLFSISLASSQSCRTVDADAKCKWPLTVLKTIDACGD